MGDLALKIERQPVLGAAGRIWWQRTASGKFSARSNWRSSRADIKHIDQFGYGAHAVDEFADPEERVEVA